MQLASSFTSAPVSISTPSKTSGADIDSGSQSLKSTRTPVPDLGVVVELSPAAAAVLERGDDTSKEEETGNGNPLAPAGLEDIMSDVELFGAADETNLPGVFQLYENPAEEVAREGEEARDNVEVQVARSSDAPAEKEKVPGELSQEERAVVDKLKSRDSAVRAHEMAHVAAAGGLAGAPSFSYQTGPDGQRYAIGGSVSIDTSPERKPEDTITKAQRIRSAALAPADPSAADRAVASRATRMESQARQALARDQNSESERARESAAATATKVQSASTEEVEETILPSLPKVETTESDVISVIPGGIATLASSSRGELQSPSQSVLRSDSAPQLYAFSGGTAAVAQLYTPSQRSLEAAFAQFAS